jgi:hypothetical protein
MAGLAPAIRVFAAWQLRAGVVHCNKITVER